MYEYVRCRKPNCSFMYLLTVGVDLRVEFKSAANLDELFTVTYDATEIMTGN